LENHPTVISEESKKIKLSKKTGIPLGVLPNQQAPAPKKGGDDLGKARPKQENKEQRKARKAQVKESRRVTPGLCYCCYRSSPPSPSFARMQGRKRKQSSLHSKTKKSDR